MALISLNGVSFAFTGPQLLDSVTLKIEAGERIGLLGRNGTGKSTLLRILQGEFDPDSGEIVREPGMRVESLEQDVPLDLDGTVREHLMELTKQPVNETAWEVETRVDRSLTQLGLDGDANVATLSAGSKRRVLLARALVANPDLLILDEPTNHLDIDAITALEETLHRRKGALVFVTHDRSFLRRLATRILDLDRGSLRSYSCSYVKYLERREAELQVESEQNAQFDRKLAEEEVWIRQGIRARRTRNEGRVRALKDLREERRSRREEVGRVTAQLQESEKSGRIVMRVKDLEFGYDGTSLPESRIVRGLTTTISRGDRIGIIGPNGSGKTTLIKLLLGELDPTSGSIAEGVKVEVAHFEQLHEVLDEEKSVADNVGDGRDKFLLGGKEKHVVGYLQDFLFTREQIRGPVTKLSGGEKKRLQLARVLSRPCNLLVLDEPTNDLDLETLELLESLLGEFQGTILVVSHDREFLNNVATSTFVFEGDAQVREYVGGYDDWIRQRKLEEAPAAPRTEKRVREKSKSQTPRLGFNEKRELEALPDRIETLEAEKETLFSKMSSPEFYKSGGDTVGQTKERLVTLEKEISTAYERWEHLEAIREASGRS